MGVRNTKTLSEMVEIMVCKKQIVPKTNCWECRHFSLGKHSGVCLAFNNCILLEGVTGGYARCEKCIKAEVLARIQPVRPECSESEGLTPDRAD